MNRLLIFICSVPFFASTLLQAQVTGARQVVKKTVIGYKDTLSLSFLHDPALSSEGWDTLPQTRFWRDILNMTSDTCIINIPTNRQALQKICRGEWTELSDSEKKFIKDSLTCSNNLDENSTTLFVTTGKSEFYELKKMLPDISKAIRIFEQNEVDPWYAQTILLIESPGKMKKKSSAGANGPFQLMRSVAKKYGLVVGKTRDDRTNLEKSARAASNLIKLSCIPKVKQNLDELNIAYHESDLWFRLLVLHTYHAGGGNVRCMLQKLQPKAGGTALFSKIWQTECGGFKNESQNYSQIAIASLSDFDELIQTDGDTVFLVTGDKKFRRYVRSAYKKPWDAFQYLNRCVTNYENDLVDGTIPYDYFTKRISKVRKELKLLAKHITNGAADFVIHTYPAPESQILSLAGRLLNKQRYDEAIALIKTNLDARPNSAAAYDLLAKAYTQSGNKQLAGIYANRSLAIRENSEPNNKD